MLPFFDAKINIISGGGGGVLGFSFAGYVPLASLFLWPAIDPILVNFWENVIFAIPTKSLSIYLFFSYPKNPKMCHPILVTLRKMQPHSSQSSREKRDPIQRLIPINLL